MHDVAQALLARVPQQLTSDDGSWQTVADELAQGASLETALDQLAPDSDLLDTIVTITAETVSAAELPVIDAILKGTQEFALAQLMPHLALSDATTIITTNYDRLVEIAAEMAGFAVDSSFVGQYVGRFDPDSARNALRSHVVGRAKTLTMRYRRHVVVRKPHGSLDWYVHNDKLWCCPYPVNLPRLMITPGGTKFLRSHEPPFDRHRELSNHAVDKAARFLTIGYGFNDPHLQTHLRQRIEAGVPTLILARTLSDSARGLIGQPSVIALERGDSKGTIVHIDGDSYEIADRDLWSLNIFVSEILV
jgi:SIR2-like domain